MLKLVYHKYLHVLWDYNQVSKSIHKPFNSNEYSYDFVNDDIKEKNKFESQKSTLKPFCTKSLLCKDREPFYKTPLLMPKGTL
jgi:hypothetical protein